MGGRTGLSFPVLGRVGLLVNTIILAIEKILAPNSCTFLMHIH